MDDQARQSGLADLVARKIEGVSVIRRQRRIRCKVAGNRAIPRADKDVRRLPAHEAARHS